MSVEKSRAAYPHCVTILKGCGLHAQCICSARDFSTDMKSTVYIYFFPGLDGLPLPTTPAQKEHVLDNYLYIYI